MYGLVYRKDYKDDTVEAFISLFRRIIPDTVRVCRRRDKLSEVLVVVVFFILLVVVAVCKNLWRRSALCRRGNRRR